MQDWQINQQQLGPLYIVTERFGPGRGSEWEKYVRWSGLTHVREIVSLDPMLCPSVLGHIIDDADWPFIVNEDFMLDYFVDLDYLLKRVGSLENKNLLCVYRNPELPPPPPSAPFCFELLGYDLVDVMGSASALTNCGGFPDVFNNSELSVHGLIPSFERVYEIQRNLKARYLENDHANCHVWAVSRAVE